MVTRHPNPFVDPIANAINKSIDRLIFSLQRRRVHLLTVLKEKREELENNKLARQITDEQLKNSRDLLECEMTHNLLRSTQERMVVEIKSKRAQLHAKIPPQQELRFECDIRDLEKHIICLGEIDQYDVPLIQSAPDYTNFQQPTVVVGKVGLVSGEFKLPRAISTDLESGHIYVADMGNSRVQIFSEMGEYINHFGSQHLINPYGILIHNENIYVTDTVQHAIFQFKLRDLTLIKRAGKEGSGKEELFSPQQLAISPNKQVYVADCFNHRLQILSQNLTFQSTLRHETMTAPSDIKFTNNEIIVLSCRDDTCIHIFTLEGEKLRSMITNGVGMQVVRAYFFCLDGENNIIISDHSDHKIKVFSEEGNLIHSIGKRGHKTGMFDRPIGIQLISNTKLICMSHNENFGLQLFSS